MNVSNIPINVIPTPKAQPKVESSALYSNKADDVGRYLQHDNPNVSKSSRLNDNKEQIQSESATTDTNSSDKITESKKHSIKHFKNVLKDKIQSDDSSDKVEGQENSTDTQSTESADNAQQVQPIETLNTIISASAGQVQQVPQDQTETKGAENIANILITKSDSAKGQSQQVTSLENQQQALTQQNQSDVSANVINAEVAAGGQVIKQEQVLLQTQKTNQTANKEPAKVDVPAAKQTKGAVKADITQINTDSQKLSTSENSNGANPESKPADTANQELLSTLPKEQANVLITKTDAQAENPAQNTVSKAGKPQKQDGQRQNTNNSNDNAQSDQPQEFQNAESDRFGENGIKGGLAQRLGVDKVELVNGKDGSPNSNPVNFAALISRGNISADGTPSVNVSNRAVITETTSSTTGNDAASTAARTDIPDTAASIRDQIYQSIQNAAASQQGNKQITVQLNPPELGRLSIKFSEKGSEVTGVVETANSQTRAEIRNAIPEIMRSLEQSGVNIKRIDVTLSDLSDKSGFSRQSNQESYRENYSQQFWDQSGNFNQEQGQNYASPNYFAQSQGFGQTNTSLTSTFDSRQSQLSSSDMLLDVLI